MDDIKVGEFVKRQIKNIFSYCDNINHDEINLLLDKRFSQKTFGITFPFCSEIEKIESKDSVRYWSETYLVRGLHVRVTSQWYEKSQPLLEKYLELKGIPQEIKPEFRKDSRWRSAIIEVLKSSKEPMHYSEITEQIIKNKLTEFDGATPARTVSFYLTTEINREGPRSVFERAGRGIYKLREGVSNFELEKEIAKKEPVNVEQETETESGPVKSLGMFWTRSSVDWKNRPSIFGRQFQESRAIDFKEQIGIYLLHDSSRIIYVGQAVERPIGQRLYEHTMDRLNGRWDRFSWFGFHSVKQNGELEINTTRSYDISQCIDAFEAVLIECSEPPLNRKRGIDFSGIEYLQVKDPKFIKRQISEILESLKEKLD